MKHIIKKYVVMGLSLFSLLSASSSFAQEKKSDDAIRCIDKRHISSFNIIDGRTIRFVTTGMKGNKDVLVTMKHSCPELEHVINLHFSSRAFDQVCASFDKIIVNEFVSCRINSLTLVPKVGSKAEKEAKKKEAEKESPTK